MCTLAGARTPTTPAGAAPAFLVSDTCHPQTIAVVRTRAEPLGIEVRVGDAASFDFAREQRVFGVLVQYPATDGALIDWRDLCKRAHDAGALVVMATDLLALTLLTPPGELGADIAVGSAQRFGVPMGFGGPHAAFLVDARRIVPQAAGPHHRRLRGHARQGRVPAGAADPRATHPPREGDLQHLHRAGAARRDGLDVRRLSRARGAARDRGARPRLHELLAAGLDKLGIAGQRRRFFDTLRVDATISDVAAVEGRRGAARINLRRLSDDRVGDLGR